MRTFIHTSAVFAFTLALLTAAAVARQKTTTPTYVYDANEGGWVDKTNNLVWGLDYAYFTTASPDGNTIGAEAIPMDWPTAQSVAANYPEALWQSGWYDASDVSAYWEGQGLQWRQPTAAEVGVAYSAGFLGNHFQPYGQTPRWTSDFKSRKGVFQGAYAIDLSTGAVQLDVGTPGFPLFVRAYR